MGKIEVVFHGREFQREDITFFEHYAGEVEDEIIVFPAVLKRKKIKSFQKKVNRTIVRSIPARLA